MLALLLLTGLLATTFFGRLLLERRLALGPTATVTGRPAPVETPTTDFRATQNLADLITQIAYNAALTGITTPTRAATATPTHTDTPTPQPATPQSTSTSNIVHVPIVSGDDSSATATPTPESQASPTLLPEAGTQTAVAEGTTTAEQVTPTSTPTTPPTVTPTAPPLVALRAVTKNRTQIFTGPSVLYTLFAELPANTSVRLEGRSESGEWVYICCENNVNGWARQAWFDIRDNQAPQGIEANDARRLLVQESEAVPRLPLPVVTAIPDPNFPLFRRDAAATGRVNARFQGPFVEDGLFRSQATANGAFSTAPIVVGSTVLAASEDGHLYSFSTEQGNQRWRYELRTVIPFAPAVQNASIYIVDGSGELFALRDTGSAADALQWRRTTGIAPSGPLNVYDYVLLLAGNNHQLSGLDRRREGEQIWSYLAPSLSSSKLHYPAVGDQMVYVGDASLSALDVYSGTLVWSDSEVNDVSAAPVYARPGVKELAEVYVADKTGRIHAFDANTGAVIWRKQTNRQHTALAVDATTVYTWGADFVSAWARADGSERWTVFVSGAGSLGGPLIGNGRLLVAGNNNVLILDAATGNIVSGLPTSPPLVGSPAVSDGDIIVAGQDGVLYKFKEAN